jgi:hypothetical protein
MKTLASSMGGKHWYDNASNSSREGCSRTACEVFDRETNFVSLAVASLKSAVESVEGVLVACLSLDFQLVQVFPHVENSLY